jgi:hypothetical protein
MSAFGRHSSVEEAVCCSIAHQASAPGDPLVGSAPWVADRDAEMACPTLGGPSIWATKRRAGKQLC